MDLLKTIVDPRKPRGVGHPLVTVVAIGVRAALSDARSFVAITEWAQRLSREGLQRLGSKRWKPPSEPTIRRVLQQLDAQETARKIGQWVAGQPPIAGCGVAVDGTSLGGAHDTHKRPPHLLSAILHQEAVVIGQIRAHAESPPRLRKRRRSGRVFGKPLIS
ncbi:MAG: transposase family protein [Acidobacteria bacterium]|nr:transposase family protein [Acidobacteriota bacterium]